MSKFVIEPYKCLFGSFVFDDSLEADEEVEYEEA